MVVPCVTCSRTLPNLQLVFSLCRSDAVTQFVSHRVELSCTGFAGSSEWHPTSQPHRNHPDLLELPETTEGATMLALKPSSVASHPPPKTLTGPRCIHGQRSSKSLGGRPEDSRKRDEVQDTVKNVQPEASA